MSEYFCQFCQDILSIFPFTNNGRGSPVPITVGGQKQKSQILFYMPAQLIPTSPPKYQLSPFYKIDFFRLTDMPNIRQLVSTREREQILVVWLLKYSEKA